MALILEKKDAVDWVYRGEGAANLVLAYIGSSPGFVGKVMRIQKASRKKPKSEKIPSILTRHERLVWKDTEDLITCSTRDVGAQKYVQCIMTPLLGSKHVDAGIRVPVSREFLESVEKNVMCQRPAWRVDAAKIDTLCDSAIVMMDHSIFPRGIADSAQCISVELKPKCGFLPFSKFITERNAIKRRATRFRMHQALKLQEKVISELSEYDPLDLFSGSEERILKAIKALFTTPQNNFRVFLNGSLIFGGLGGGTGITNFLKGEAFEDVLKCVIRADNGLRTTSFLQLVAKSVFQSRVLDRLLEVQKLDKFDIEGAIHAYYNILCQPCKVCRELGEDEASHRYKSLHCIPLDESLNIVRDYLISATVKDCSLMISFKPRAVGDPGSSHFYVHLEPTRQIFDYKAYFIDLDLKPMDKMEYYYELDKKIVNNYNEMLTKEHGVSEPEILKAYESQI